LKALSSLSPAGQFLQIFLYHQVPWISTPISRSGFCGGDETSTSELIGSAEESLEALADGNTGGSSFHDQKVRDPRRVALRDRVKIEADATLSPSRAKIRIVKKDGRVLEKFMGTLDLSKDREKMEKELTRKFQDLSTPILGEEKQRN